jgi:drug/metabolite transporter (DMT)-like permease
MSSEVNAALVVGLPTAMVSAALYGVAPLVQALAARRESAGRGLGLGLLARLAVRPLWLLGLAVEALSFLLEVYSLSVAPVALVAPVMAADMVVFVLLAHRMLGERITRVGVFGILSLVCGIGLLAYAFERDAGVGEPATDGEVLAFLVLGLIFTLGCGFFANRAGRGGEVVPAALGFGLAAGVGYAISVLATRQIGLFVNEQRDAGGDGRGDLFELLATPTPYVLVLFSVLALGLEQRGLQGRAAVVAFPVTSGVSAFLPVTLGLSLFGEPVPGGGRLVILVCSMALVAGGIAGLGRDRAAAGRYVDGVGEAGDAAGPLRADGMPPLGGVPAHPASGSSDEATRLPRHSP